MACKQICLRLKDTIRHCNIWKYLMGYYYCTVCQLGYIPEKKDGQPIHCVCCNNKMQSKPRKKQMWHTAVGTVFH